MREPYRSALEWLRSHVAARLDGTAPLEPRLEPSLGQLLSTLLACGERGRAERVLETLLESQRADGSWPGSSARSAERETADAVRGLVAARPSRPAVEARLRQACAWLLGPGRASHGETGWKDATGRLAVAGALAAVGAELDDPTAREAARTVASGRGSLVSGALRSGLDLARPGPHSHRDELGLLLDLGRDEQVRDTLQEGEGPRPEAGEWCPTCAAQLASAWYRLGQRGPAERTLASLLAAQDGSGALPDRAGPRAGHTLPSPAATRELLEAIHRHVEGAFDLQVGVFEDHIRAGDGRFSFLLREAGPLAGQRVLDAGCGRGAITRALLTAFASAGVAAVDLSREMLRHVPASAQRRVGSIQSLPFEDGRFDVAFCVEALEHALNPEGAVLELSRVVRPGGRVVVVDKNAERQGALAIETWERWFERSEVEGWLRSSCDDVRSELLVHCPELGPDLFVGWRGTRR